jgi:hypothetical protein
MFSIGCHVTFFSNVNNMRRKREEKKKKRMKPLKTQLFTQELFFFLFLSFDNFFLNSHYIKYESITFSCENNQSKFRLVFFLESDENLKEKKYKSLVRKNLSK